jgi:sugar phosphate isomerase/epimerase
MHLVHNSNSTMHLPVLLQARVAKEVGWDGIFVRAEHVRRYLDSEAGTFRQLRAALDPLEPVNLGALRDVERWRPPERAAMLREAEAITELAVGIGARYVQLLSGPVDPGGDYGGPAELTRGELRRVTAEGLRSVADIGTQHGIRYYLEPLAWTPLSSLDLAVEAIDAAQRDNVGLVLDYWHLWNSGATPETLAKLDPRIIFGVDFSDSLGPAGAGMDDQRSRRVWPGDGAIPLREWTDAIRSTGFDGWWDIELYSPPHWELDPFEIAHGLLEVLRGVLDE